MNDRRFKPSESHRLEDPERLVWLPPMEVLAHLALHPGIVVADIGAGTGYFSIPMARAVSPGGKVLAVDVQTEMLEKLSSKLGDVTAPKNIELHEGESACTHLPDKIADRVLMANVWHEIDDHTATLQEVHRILKPDGLLVILDWRPDVDRPPGPPLDHRIDAKQVIFFLSSYRWKVEEFAKIGKYSYLVSGRIP